MSELLYMYTGSTAGYSHIATADFEVGIAPMPQVSDETGAVIQQGTNVCLYLIKTNQKKKFICLWVCLKYLSSYEGNLLFATETSYLPIRESVVASDAYQIML